MKICLSIVAILLLYTSCNNLSKKNLNSDSDSTSNTIVQEETETHKRSVEDKFLGSWKFYGLFPENAQDKTMNGIICELEKYKNTKETYVFHLWTGNDLILSVKDENNLVGENATIKIEYIENTNHLKLKFEAGNGIEFRKLE